jgi:hypothetical protein
MQIIIDGYNLLHAGRLLTRLDALELQGERDRLIDRLSEYRRVKSCEITVVFDGWQGGWSTEKKEKRKGVDVIFSKLGEQADEVIKRLVRARGAGAIVVTSDRDLGRYVERMSVAVIPSDLFKKRLEGAVFEVEEDVAEDRADRRKGPSKRLSKKQKRLKGALKKL